MRRTIVMLALALAIGLFGLVWGTVPGQAQVCRWFDAGATPPILECVGTQGESADVGLLPSPLHINFVGSARMGQLFNFSDSLVTIEPGARITTRDNYPGVYAPGGTNNTVINHGNVTTIRLAGNDNKITNYGTFRQTEGNPHSYTVAIEGTTSVLTNESGGLITGRTAVRSTDAREIINHGTIEGTVRAIEVQGSADQQSTIITNTGTIRHTSGEVAIRRLANHSRNASVFNSGEIVGSIRLLGDRPGWVINEENAKIDGSVQTGEGTDKVENHSGAIIRGNVGLGGGEGDVLTNDGTIEGAVTAGGGSSGITNTGFIGRMSLGAGNDTVTNAAGATVGGTLALGSGAVVLVNLGRIEGTVSAGAGTSDITNRGFIATIALSGAGNDTVTNTEDGTIDGDVGLGDGDDILVNRGSIGGAVTSGAGTSNTTNHSTIASFALGEGDDTVKNEETGTIAGNVGLGAGDDVLKNFGRIEGTVTAGAGTSDITNAGFIDRIRLGAGDDTVTNTGSIDGNVDLGNGTDKVTNAGTISGVVNLGGGAAGTDKNTLDNSGTISGGVIGGNIENIVTNEDGAEISGDITLGSANDELTNITGATIDGNVNMRDGTDKVTNAGVISGRLDLGGGVAGTDENILDNSGTIGQGVFGGDIQNIVTNEDGGEISGGITLGSADDEVTNEAGGRITGDVTLGAGDDKLLNKTGATIIGNVALGDGDDVLTNEAGATIDGNVGLGDGDDKLVNDGRIEGTVTAGAGTANVTNEGFIDRIRLGAGNDTVTNTGSIDGNVDLGNGDNTLDTSGTIGGNLITGTGTDHVNITGTLQGSVSGGSGVDIVTVGSNAQVFGNVLLGGGDDQLILQEWDGSQILGTTMDGGAGDDRLILEGGEGTLLTSAFRNFENVTVRNEGEWTISGSIPTSGGFLTSTLAGLWLEGDGNTVAYAHGGEIAVQSDGGRGVLVDGDDNVFTNAGRIHFDGLAASGIRVDGNRNIVMNTADSVLFGQGGTVSAFGIDGGDNSFTNDGTIDVSGADARGLNVWGSGNTVTNTEGASIVADGDNNIGAVFVGSDNVLTNEGDIDVSGTSARGVTVFGAGNTIRNAADGSISVEGDEAVGVHIEGADNRLDNAGTIDVRGADEVAAVQVVSNDANADANVITNTGTIRAESDSGNARGIVTTGDGKTQIHNELGALIEADIAIHAGGDGAYGITNDGTIRGDIVLGDGDHVVQNDGDIFGDIRLGDGNHDITNDGFLSGNIDLSQSVGDHKVELVGGSLWDPGLIQLGTGDDVLTYSTVANDMTAGHTLDGGDGDDTLILVDDGYLNLYNIVNFETLELRDAGTWQFHRDVSFRDAVTAGAGHLILGNATEGGIEFGTGGLTIGSDARLSGTGTVTGDVTIEGRVAPGHSFGILNVAGNYTQAAGSTYEVEMAIDGRRDLIHATGTATIANDTLLDITAEYGYYDPTHRWNVLKADGGVTGTYAKAEWDIDLLFLGPEATTEAKDVYIDLVHAGPSFASVAGTPNQKAVAAALDAAEAAGVGMGVVNMVLPALDIADARQAYDSLHGEIYAQHRWVTLSSTQDFVAAANKGIDSNGGAKSVWGSVHKGTGNVKSQGEYMGVEHDHLGLVVGWTAWANDTWGLGLLGGMSNVSVAVADAASSGTGQGQKFGAYARYDNGRFGASAQVVSGQDRFAVDRDLELLGNPLDDQKAKAEYGGSNLAVSLAGSLNYKLGDYELKPTLVVNMFSISRAAFTETGAGAANLTVKADEYSVTQGVLGLTVTAPVPEGQAYTPQFRVAYVTNFGGFASEFDAAFAVAKDVPFTIGGEAPADGGFIAGASIRGETGKAGLSYELTYDGKFFGPATVHTIGGGLGYSF